MSKLLIQKLVTYLQTRNVNFIQMFIYENETILSDEYADIWTEYNNECDYKYILCYLTDVGCKVLLNKYKVHYNIIIDNVKLLQNIDTNEDIPILNKYEGIYKSIIIKNTLSMLRENIFYMDHELVTYMFTNAIWTIKDKQYYDGIRSYRGNNINIRYIIEFYDVLKFRRSLRGTWIMAITL